MKYTLKKKIKVFISTKSKLSSEFLFKKCNLGNTFSKKFEYCLLNVKKCAQKIWSKDLVYKNLIESYTRTV